MVGFRLHTADVVADGASPSRWALMMHGVFGSGSNWRTIARRVTERRPDWGIALVDLRMHGKSQGAPPPHTLQAAAGDVRDVIADLRARGRAVAAVCGHSFGGKVTLQLVDDPPPGVAVAWVLDASPHAAPAAFADVAPASTVGVLDMLDALPRRYASRDDMIARIVDRGHTRAIAHWLAMNLERRDDGAYHLALDLDAIRALLRDYFATDLWHVVERPAGPALHFVVAGRSSVFTDDALARLRAAARSWPRVTVHELPRASHWVNVDAADAVVDAIAASLE